MRPFGRPGCRSDQAQGREDLALWNVSVLPDTRNIRQASILEAQARRNPTATGAYCLVITVVLP